MSSTARSFSLPYLFACALALLALGGFWYALGKPVTLPDAASPTHKLQCASYTPFDKDQSPFDQPFKLRPARMDADLALLATRFQCIRTYSMTGLEEIPALARKHGLKLMLGAWVNRNPVDTQVEVKALIASANANPDVVTSVIVGNETLLRKEVTGAQLVALIKQVKAAVKQPVTYADVWEFWDQYPEVGQAVDFLTIHLLPYWEDHPKGIDDALAHVASIHDDFAKRFAPREIVIGETGWPSQGRQRQTALPSRVNEAKFIRSFVTMAEQRGWHYNLIEAFDQPWKRASEGAVGGYWGLFDADRQNKGVLEGPVSNLPFWPQWLGAGVLLWLALLVLAGRPKAGRGERALPGHLFLPVLAAIGAASLGVWGELMRVTARFTGEWLWAGVVVALNLLVLAQAALELAHPTGARSRLLAWLQQRAGAWAMAAGFAGAVMMLAMVFEPRYRSFPTAALVVPALVYLFRPVRVRRNETLLLALIIAAGIVPQMAREGVQNPQAWGFALVSGVLAWALWRCVRAGR
jgi:glucan 1,3-beta-glucosidase